MKLIHCDESTRYGDVRRSGGASQTSAYKTQMNLIKTFLGRPGEGSSRKRFIKKVIFPPPIEPVDVLVRSVVRLHPSVHPQRPTYSITEQRVGYRSVMRLVIRKFSKSDIGTYHCVSSNSLGKAEQTLRLYGTYPDIDFAQ